MKVYNSVCFEQDQVYCEWCGRVVRPHQAFLWTSEGTDYCSDNCLKAELHRRRMVEISKPVHCERLVNYVA